MNFPIVNARRQSGAGFLCLLMCLSGGVAGRASEASSDLERIAGEVDRLLEVRLADAGVPASPAASDAEFLRRVTLDLTGRIPTRREARSFLADDATDKRGRLIDGLLDRPAYGKHFATLWKERIFPRNTGKAGNSRDPFLPWLARQFNDNRSWNEIVTALLTAKGRIRRHPESGFILSQSVDFEPKPNLLADATARLFWGVQLRCAECHDHPFASWTQEDFWSTAAFFSRLRKGYTDGKNPVGWTLTEAAPDEPISRKFWKSPAAPGVEGPSILIPESAGEGVGNVVRGRFLGEEGPGWTDAGPYLPRFAAWATGPEHPYFTRNAVNRIWAHLFGRGLVEPLEEMGPETPGTHPEILELLARTFAADGQDRKRLLSILCRTRAYQRTSRPLEGNRADRTLFSRMAVKVMRPEVLHDSLSLVLYPPVPKPGRKGKVYSPRVRPIPGISRHEFAAFFGTPGIGAKGSVVNQAIPQYLRLMNGPLLNTSDWDSEALGRDAGGARERIKSLFLSAYARPPAEEEFAWAQEYLTDSSDPEKGFRGLLWALLNSAEFVLNH